MTEQEPARVSIPAGQWAQSRLAAEVWWCGDGWCDCTKPQIVRITPNRDIGYPWVRREVAWEGEFMTDTWTYGPAERELAQFGPLREACARYGTEVPEVARQLPPDLGGCAAAPRPRETAEENDA